MTQNLCNSCRYWAQVGPLHGECSTANQHEFMVSLPVRKLTKEGHYAPFIDPNFMTGKPRMFAAVMLTSQDFGCVQHEPKE